MPGPGTTAIVEDLVPILLTVTGQDVEVTRLVLRGGPVDLGVSDATVLATGEGPFDCPALLVGGPGATELRISLGFPGDGAVEVASAVIGTDDGAGAVRPASISLFARLLVTDRLTVGGTSDGLIERLGRLEAGRLVAGDGARGTITDVAELVVMNRLTVGGDDLGELRETAFAAGELVLGDRRGGLGTVTVDPGDASTVDGTVEVGARGFGHLQVRDELTVGGDLLVGVYATGEQPSFFDRGDGLVVVGPGIAPARLEVGGDLVLGVLGHARLEIEPRARVVVDGSVFSTVLPQEVDRSMMIRLADPDALGTPGGDDPVLLASGDVQLPPLEVRLDDRFVPEIGDGWVLAEAGGDVSVESLALPVLPAGLAWLVSDAPGRLLVSVVGGGGPPATDLDGDGLVGLADLLIVLAAFGPCPPGDPCPADLDGSGAVDVVDVVAVLADWG